MTVLSAYRGQFVSDAVATASPARLLTMLYDRLVLDLVRAEHAFREDAGQGASDLVHAQDIVVELRCSLDVAAWSGGPALASLYAYLLTELIALGTSRDAEAVARVRAMVEDLRDAWREAALVADSSAASLAAVAP